jgi:predicted amidophosphoribosyltransferase
VPPGVHRAPTAIEGVSALVTLGSYAGPLGRAVKDAKLRGERPLAIAIAEAFAQRTTPILASGPRPFTLVPAPTSLKRRRQRGFCLSTLMCHAVAKRTGMPLVHALRLTSGPRQASLGLVQRRSNLVGRVRPKRPVIGSVWLIDDVVTTGSTAAACARELLGDRSAAVMVACMCVTRPPSQNRDSVSKLRTDAYK